MKLTAVCFPSLVLWTARRQPAAHQNVETIFNITQQEGSLTKLIQTDLAVTLSRIHKAPSPKQSEIRYF